MSSPSPVSHPTGYARAIALALAAVVLVSVVLLAFAWPSITADPKGIPIGVVGNDEQVAQIEKTLEAQSDGVFALQRRDDREAAIDAIQRREEYGAIVLGDPEAADPSKGAPEVLTATAANASVAQMLQSLATGLQTRLNAQVDAKVEQQVQSLLATLKALSAGQRPPGGGETPAAPDSFTMPSVTVTVTDAVPFAERDPRGAGLASATLPLVMGGMLGAILISTAVHGSRRRLVALLVYGVAGGLALAGILQVWFGALQGDYWLNAAAVGLSIVAISSTLVGLRSLIGMPGLGAGAALMFLFANPISSAQTPMEFLLRPWGAVGQWFPPGAGANLVRTLSYFPEAPTAFPWLVLGGWAVLGIVLIGLAALRRPQPGDDPGEVEGAASRTPVPAV
ncbi:hypothetical protein [Microbacterium sp.]|uniref:hypothetical protein n=1 Tax=Microbacterium sp. TaxID=51671 RepID=UPI003342536A